MDLILISLIISAIAILALIITNVILLWNFNLTKKKIDELLEKGNIKDFKDIFLSQKDKANDLEKKIEEAFLRIKNLDDICKTTIQKVSVVRFDPFNEMGGKQSFAIALMDAENNGFVVSSLFVKEGNRVYAKAVKKGKSDYVLSKEELEAIEKAINSK